MALKKSKVYQKVEENNNNLQEVNVTPKSIVNNQTSVENESTVSSEDVTSEVESNLGEVVEEKIGGTITSNNGDGNKNEDDFFKEDTIGKMKSIFTQNLSRDTSVGKLISCDDLELDLNPKITIEARKYKFQVVDVSVEKDVPNDYGVKDKITIKFSLHYIGEEGLVEHMLNQRYNISTHYKSFFFQAYKRLTGTAPFGRINVKKLLGIIGDCEVEHIAMPDGNIFPKITNIKPILKNVSTV